MLVRKQGGRWMLQTDFNCHILPWGKNDCGCSAQAFSAGHEKVALWVASAALLPPVAGAALHAEEKKCHPAKRLIRSTLAQWFWNVLELGSIFKKVSIYQPFKLCGYNGDIAQVARGLTLDAHSLIYPVSFMNHHILGLGPPFGLRSTVCESQL